jgi:phosphoribosylformylglycinamidine synthase
MDALARATSLRLVRACHDLSEGGLAVAAAEMAFAGALGLELDLREVPADPSVDRSDLLLFSESNSRFLVEVAKDRAAEFEKVMKTVACRRIGRVVAGVRLVIRGLEGNPVVDEDIEALRSAWKKPLAW